MLKDFKQYDKNEKNIKKHEKSLISNETFVYYCCN